MSIYEEKNFKTENETIFYEWARIKNKQQNYKDFRYWDYQIENTTYLKKQSGN